MQSPQQERERERTKEETIKKKRRRDIAFCMCVDYNGTAPITPLPSFSFLSVVSHVFCKFA